MNNVLYLLLLFCGLLFQFNQSIGHDQTGSLQTLERNQWISSSVI